MRGGTLFHTRRFLCVSGLSPQARGKRNPGDHGAGREVPIPAGAGETFVANFSRGTPWAYPRRRGGNAVISPRLVPLKGLSPQARGKLLDLGSGTHHQGPIPAGAGETS